MHFSQYLIELDNVGSTNNYALEALKLQKAQHGTCIFAHSQTNGKGQMGKQWHSKANKNITTSIVIDINDAIFSNPFTLMAFGGVSCCLFLNSILDNPCCVKWPNDIYYNDKKAGGILIETTKVNNIKYAVVGIGLNVNEENFSESLNRAISLKQITQKDFNILETTENLWKFVMQLYIQWKTLSIDEIASLYNKLLYKKNEIIRFKKNRIVTTGIIEGVNKNGELQLKDALWETVTVGSIEWIFD